MAQLSLGIDIGDDLLSGVVVAGNGREAKVVSCACNPLNGLADDELVNALPLLLEQLRWRNNGPCDVGLSLSRLSLRNLSLPFTDKKKIEQVLPFELEEQLLFPVDQHIIATAPTASATNDDTATKLLVAAVEKSTLAKYLEFFKEQGIEPDRVSPSGFVLADCLNKGGHESDHFLLLRCGLGSTTMVVVHHGIIVFMRRLTYPDEVFTSALFSFDGKEINTSDPDAAEEAVRDLCGIVQRSTEYFTLQRTINLQPDFVVLSGPMLLGQGFLEKMESELGLPCRRCDIAGAKSGTLSAAVAGHWLPALYDTPLALALRAGNKKKDIAFNFRRDAFARPHQLLRSKKQLAGAALTAGFLFLLVFGCLFIDYKSLQKQHDGLSAKMEQVFIKSFPGIDPGRDPLMHMRSKLKEMDTGTVSMPIFTHEKRILVLLADISARIPASIELHVTRLIIDQDSVKINGTTDSYNSVNTITSLLSGSDQYSEVKPGKSSKVKGGIRFEIELQLVTGENS